ncbi:MAG: hypothetical protein ACFFFT_09910 [Candidatus Thorarchaeota archaeon]
MDSGEDFITPEFLNILFFQQKNLVIFPYVDLKHLHALEIFTVGYSSIDLESTALHDLKIILDFESSNTYSQSPTFYFIYNLDREKVKEILTIKNIHCILNSNEIIPDLANGSEFVFYNKKNSQFVNYSENRSTLDFEQHLISNSQNKTILQDKIQSIKNVGSQIFTEVSQNNSPIKIPKLLKNFPQKYWEKILGFTSRYFGINIPPISQNMTESYEPPPKGTRTNFKDFTDEYEIIVSLNKALGKEFIQQLHDFRSKRVNPEYLELEELYSPLKLYNYLRNRHWKEGIPQNFIDKWLQMDISQYTLTESDIADLETIFAKLGLPQSAVPPSHMSIISFEPESEPKPERVELMPSIQSIVDDIPSLQEWKDYSNWVNHQLQTLTQLIDNNIVRKQNKNLKSYLLEELIVLGKFLGIKHPRKYPTQKAKKSVIGENLKKEILIKLNQIRIQWWIELFVIKDKFRFVLSFFKKFERLHEDIFGKTKKDMPQKIEDLTNFFHFPQKVKNNLLWFNRLRNKITHLIEDDTQVEMILNNKWNQIKNTFMRFLINIVNHQVNPLITHYGILPNKLYAYISSTFFSVLSSNGEKFIYERLINA